MSKKQRTRTSKKRASTKHKAKANAVIVTPREPVKVQKAVPTATTTPVAKISEQSAAEGILGYPLQLVYQDIVRTLVISVLIIGILLVLAWLDLPALSA